MNERQTASAGLVILSWLLKCAVIFSAALGVYIRKGSSDNRISGAAAISSSDVLFTQSDPTGTASDVTRMPDATTIKYFVQSTSYGYAPDTTYRYVVAYSE